MKEFLERMKSVKPKIWAFFVGGIGTAASFVVNRFNNKTLSTVFDSITICGTTGYLLLKNIETKNIIP